MDIDTDMEAVQFEPKELTPTSLKFEIEDLSDKIESLLSLMFSKRAKLFELRDKHLDFSTQDLIHLLDLEIQKLQREHI